MNLCGKAATSRIGVDFDSVNFNLQPVAIPIKRQLSIIHEESILCDPLVSLKRKNPRALTT